MSIGSDYRAGLDLLLCAYIVYSLRHVKLNSSFLIVTRRCPTGRNCTVPPCGVSGRPGGGRPLTRVTDDDRRQTADDADRQQRVKQYWPIRRASNNIANDDNNDDDGNKIRAVLKLKYQKVYLNQVSFRSDRNLNFTFTLCRKEHFFLL